MYRDGLRVSLRNLTAARKWPRITCCHERHHTIPYAKSMQPTCVHVSECSIDTERPGISLGGDPEGFRVPGLVGCRRHNDLITHTPISINDHCELTVACLDRWGKLGPSDITGHTMKVQGSKHTWKKGNERKVEKETCILYNRLKIFTNYAQEQLKNMITWKCEHHD